MAFGLTPQTIAVSALLLTAAAEEPESINPILGWLPFILIAAAFYYFAIRPQRRQRESVRSFQRDLEVGDEVRTAGGIIGVVTSLSDSEVMLDVGGVTMRFMKGAIVGPAGSDEA